MHNGIRWGMIGCGNVTEVKSGPGLQEAEGASLHMVASRNADEAADWARRHGVERWTGDPDELISHPEVDAVYIATTPDSHRYYTEKVAAVGKPVFCEKPMACNLADAIAMKEACDEAGVPLYTSYYRRALPRFLKIKEWLEAGHIGTPLFVSIQLVMRADTHPVAPITKEMAARGEIPWRFKPEIGGGGNFADMGTHMLDLMDFYLAPFAEVEGHAANRGGLYAAEDTVSACFRLENGVFGTGHWCCVAGTDLDLTEIVGTEGAIRYATFDNSPLELETRSGIQSEDIPIPAHSHLPIIQMVTDALLGRGIAPSDADNGIRALRVQEQILAGYTPLTSAETDWAGIRKAVVAKN
jgi:predicted dehydrogenase